MLELKIEYTSQHVIVYHGSHASLFHVKMEHFEKCFNEYLRGKTWNGSEYRPVLCIWSFNPDSWYHFEKLNLVVSQDINLYHVLLVQLNDTWSIEDLKSVLKNKLARRHLVIQCHSICYSIHCIFQSLQVDEFEPCEQINVCYQNGTFWCQFKTDLEAKLRQLTKHFGYAIVENDNNSTAMAKTEAFINEQY